MLSIFTASTRCSERTGSPVNGDRSWAVGAGECFGCATVTRSPPRSASSPPATRPARVTTATAPITLLCWVHLIAPPGRARCSVAGIVATPPQHQRAGRERLTSGYQRLESGGPWSPLSPPVSTTWPHEQSGEWGAMDNEIEPGSVRLMEASSLEALFTSLDDAGYRVIGPTVRD